MGLFKNHNNISDTEKEVEEYIKRRKQESTHSAADANQNSGFQQQAHHYSQDTDNKYGSAYRQDAYDNNYTPPYSSYNQISNDGSKKQKRRVITTVIVTVIGLVATVVCAFFSFSYSLIILSAVFFYTGFSIFYLAVKSKMVGSGVALIIAGIVAESIGAIMYTGMYPILFISLFMLIGVCIIIPQNLKWKRVRRVCTEKLVAVVTGLELYRRGPGEKVCFEDQYCPIYQYEYRGKTYVQLRGVVYRGTDVPKLGDVTDILINPNNPEEIYFVDNGEIEKPLNMLIGTMFILIPALMEVLFVVQVK